MNEKIEFIGDYSMESMLRRAVQNAAHNFPKSTYNWCAVQRIFGYGSTTSIQLCQHFGINPWEEVQDNRRASPKPDAPLCRQTQDCAA